MRTITTLAIALSLAACTTTDPVVRKDGTQGTIVRIEQVLVANGRVWNIDNIADAGPKGREGQQVTILLDNEIVMTFVQEPPEPTLKVNDKVRIEGVGQDQRLVRR